MAYTVNYTRSGTIVRSRSAKDPKRTKTLTAVCAVIILTFSIMKLLSFDRIRQFLIPGDPQVTKAAFCELAENVRQGQAVNDAVEAFCRQVLSAG